jgi:replicative DNA helicase
VAEQHVIAALLTSDCERGDVLSALDEGCFSAELHQIVFAMIRDADMMGVALNDATILSKLPNDEYIPGYTTHAYIAAICRAGRRLKYSWAAIVDMATELRRLSSINQALTVAQDAVETLSAVAADTNPSEIAEGFERQMAAITATAPKSAKPGMLREFVAEAVAEARRVVESGGGNQGVTSGLKALDEHFYGFHPTDLIIVGGRPGSGKTALAMSMAIAAAKAGAHVGVFSMEMAGKQLGYRVLAPETGVNAGMVRKGSLTQYDLERMEAMEQQLSGLDIAIDPRHLTVDQVAAQARRWKREIGLDVIVIDYIQIMNSVSSGRESRTGELSRIMVKLKGIAKELEIAVVALSQVSRDVAKRAKRRPTMADLAESSSIENNADLILLVHRESYYLEQEQPDETNVTAYTDWLADMQRHQGRAELVIAKNRHGKDGLAVVEFDGTTTSFKDLSSNSNNLMEDIP